MCFDGLIMRPAGLKNKQRVVASGFRAGIIHSLTSAIISPLFQKIGLEDLNDQGFNGLSRQNRCQRR